MRVCWTAIGVSTLPFAPRDNKTKTSPSPARSRSPSRSFLSIFRTLPIYPHILFLMVEKNTTWPATAISFLNLWMRHYLWISISNLLVGHHIPRDFNLDQKSREISSLLQLWHLLEQPHQDGIDDWFYTGHDALTKGAPVCIKGIKKCLITMSW